MIKITGIILISSAISACGAYLSAKITQRKKFRKALFELLLYIKTCIENGNLPLNRIYENFYDSDAEKYGFLTVLRKSGLKDALISVKDELPEELYELYLSFSESAGKSLYSSSESALCARYVELIKEKEKKIAEKEAVKQLLFRRLGILCGLLAALLLI